MANIGEITEVINNSNKFTLELGADKHILLQELRLVDGRSKLRKPTTDGNVRYHYGAGDIYFIATMLASTPEISDFNTMTQRGSSGDLTQRSYLIKCTDKAGLTKTITVTSTIPSFDLIKDKKGGAKFRVTFQCAGDTISVA